MAATPTRLVRSFNVQLIGLDRAELTTALREMGEPAFRGGQLAEWIYRRGATDFSALSNLSKPLREKLAAQHALEFPQVAARYTSDDGSAKLLLRMHDGETIETVRLPYTDRLSVCVSSQAGCAMACAFCATGLGGFRRNLTTAEIISQALLAARNAAPSQEAEFGETSPNAPDQLSHIVFMGMGEPLLNLDNVLKSIHLLHDEMGVPMRNITVSTVGILKGIARLAEQKLQLTLAVSLHAPFDELRHRLIPTSRKTRVSEIIAASRDYVAQTGRRVTFEYVVLGGVNDQAAQARELARLCKGWPAHVNLIPWNAVPDARLEGQAFNSPSPADLREFRAILERSGVAVTQRVQRGADVAAACGQLRALNTLPTPLATPTFSGTPLPLIASAP